MTSGASQALQLAIAAVSNPGCNILLPQPGFPLYQTLCEYYGVEFRFYSLLPERGWEADIAHIRSLADSRTAAIVICNPSNPCGSVFAEAHLQELLAAAAALKLVVISDEVYADIAFGDGARFVPAARALPSLQAPSALCSRFYLRLEFSSVALLGGRQRWEKRRVAEAGSSAFAHVCPLTCVRSRVRRRRCPSTPRS